MANTRPPQYTVQIITLVTPEMRQRLRKLARKRRISMNECVRQLIEAAQ